MSSRVDQGGQDVKGKIGMGSLVSLRGALWREGANGIRSFKATGAALLDEAAQGGNGEQD